MRAVAHDIVGRRAELGQLSEALSRSSLGRLTLVLVSGPAGMGKSALLRRCREVHRTDPTLMLTAECSREGGLRPFDPFLVRGGQFAEDIGPVLPVERSVLDLPERHRASHAIAGKLRHLSADRTVCLAIEDAQWADEYTLELPEFLSRRAADTACALIVTYRAEDAERPALADAIARLRARGAIEVEVGPLDRLEIGSLVRSALGLTGETDPALQALVAERSEGNPLLAEEILRSLIDRGVLRDEAGTWRLTQATGDMIIPTSVGEGVRRRISQQAPAAQHILATAAVIGRRFSFDLLAAVVGEGRSSVLEALRVGVGAQIIEEQVSDPQGYRFRHALIRDGLLATLLDPERRDIHRAVGIALELRAPSVTPPTADELAYHFDAAGDVDRAIRYHLIALRGLEPTAAAARSHVDRALALSAEDHPDRAEMLRRRAASAMQSKSNTLAPAIESARESLAIAQRTGDAHGAARSKVLIGLLGALWGDRESIPILREGVADLEGAGPSADLAEAYLQLARVAMLAGLPDAVPVAQRAVALARSHGSRTLLAHALVTLGPSMVQVDEDPAGLDVIREGIALAREVGSQYALQRGADNLWSCLISAGAPEDEIGEAERAMAVEAPDASELAYCAFFDGDWDHALERTALIPAQSTAAAFSSLVASFITVARDGPEDLGPVRRAHAWIETLLPVNAGSALAVEIFYLAGMPREALEMAEYAARLIAQRLKADFLSTASIAALASAIALRDDQAIERWIALCGTERKVESATASGRRAYAHAETLLREDRRDDAIAELENAATLLERRGATLLARTIPRLRRAELLAADDPAAAQRDLAAVMAMWRAVGAKWYLSRLREWADAHGLRGWTVAARRGPHLTPREVEVARRVAEGLTNKAIGAALGITERTAETHVQRILTKLDLRSRAQLAAWVGGSQPART